MKKPSLLFEGRAKSCAGNGTIIEPISTISELFICLVFRWILSNTLNRLSKILKYTLALDLTTTELLDIHSVKKEIR